MDNKTKILIGLAVTIAIAGAGVTTFFLLRQNKVNKPLGGAGGSPIKAGAGQTNGGSSTGDTAAQQAYDIATYGTTGEVPSDWSQVETGFDGEYNYQKRSGIWWTAKKSNPTNWVSLADPQWASAVDKLNAAYPND